ISEIDNQSQTDAISINEALSQDEGISGSGTPAFSEGIAETISNYTAAPTSMSAVKIFENGTDVDATSFVTESWVPQANTLYFLGISPVVNSGDAIPNSIVGNNLTWIRVPKTGGGNTGGETEPGSGRNILLYYAIGSNPTTGSITI